VNIRQAPGTHANVRKKKKEKKNGKQKQRVQKGCEQI
jgi:hypothetical protein